MKVNATAIIVAGVIVAGAIMVSRAPTSPRGEFPSEGNNVSVVDGMQYIDIGAKGGYTPRVTSAASGIPTTIRVRTAGTFDCSSALVLPSIGYRKNLPPTGTTEIALPPQPAGSVLKGLCSMGMYNFQIAFQ